jgi:CubicO group peptidase (beta-lactamase class C family)
VVDLLTLCGEWLAPTLISPATMASAVAAWWPDLGGVLPGFGRQDPNPWGLGFELKGAKAPHWTGSANSPATFGHFGRSGTFLWVDPVAAMACVALTDEPFGPWALTAWPALSDAVLAGS